MSPPSVFFFRGLSMALRCQRRSRLFNWYQCFYPHWSRKLVSPGIFIMFLTHQIYSSLFVLPRRTNISYICDCWANFQLSHSTSSLYSFQFLAACIAPWGLYIQNREGSLNQTQIVCFWHKFRLSLDSAIGHKEISLCRCQKVFIGRNGGTWKMTKSFSSDFFKCLWAPV